MADNPPHFLKTKKSALLSTIIFSTALVYSSNAFPIGRAGGHANTGKSSTLRDIKRNNNKELLKYNELESSPILSKTLSHENGGAQELDFSEGYLQLEQSLLLPIIPVYENQTPKEELFSEFPLLKAPGSRTDPRLSLKEIADTPLNGSDAHEQRYARDAFIDYVSKNPRLSHLGLERWRYRAKDIHHLWSIVERLEAPLPGGEPEIVFFLDRAIATSPIAEMSKAWTEKKRAKPRLLAHQDIELLLSEFRGRTLILIGHIDGRQFVQEVGSGRAALRLDIPTLIDKAQRKGVFVVPIGCNSAEAGAHFGFTRPIHSNEVASLLRELPHDRISLGDLLAAFNVIGPISLDAGKLNEYLEVTVHKLISDSREEPIVVARIPPLSTQSNISAQFHVYQRAWEAENRPFLDSGPLAIWRFWYRTSPIFTLFASGLSIVAAAVGWKWLRMRLIRRKNLITYIESYAIEATAATGVIFLLSAGARFIFPGWEPFIWLVVGVGVLMAINSMDLIGEENKEGENK